MEDDAVGDTQLLHSGAIGRLVAVDLASHQKLEIPFLGDARNGLEEIQEPLVGTDEPEEERDFLGPTPSCFRAASRSLRSPKRL
jgi:hypothetical protein